MAELSTLARPYARAAFACAEQHRVVDDWVQWLSFYAVAVREPRIARELRSPLRSVAKRAELLQSLYGDAVDERFAAFLRLLARNGRLPLLPAIDAHFRRLRAERQRSLKVEIRTADALSNADQSAIAKRLTEMLEREVEIQLVREESLLGGAVIRAGDTVIDGSVRGRLKRLADAVAS